MYKVIKTIAVCVIIVGFFWIFGTVGANDYALFNREVMPLSETFAGIMRGAGVSLAGGLLYFFTAYIQYEKGKRRNTDKESKKR